MIIFITQHHIVYISQIQQLSPNMDYSDSEPTIHPYIIRTPFNMSINQLRHSTVFQLFEEHNISKLLDLGCSEGQFLRMAARSPKLEHLVGLDIEEEALRESAINTIPEQLQYSIQYDRKKDLIVEVYEGNLLKPYEALKNVGFQMVSLIEVIQHLPLADVQRASKIIFGFLRPRIVAITTPNKEFNVHFGDKEDKLRHWDHKFQWTRKQFLDYCLSVQKLYGYNFTLKGLGEHVSDSTKGCCTQMAVFTLISETSYQLQFASEEKFELKLRANYLIPCWKSRLDLNVNNLFYKGLRNESEVSFQNLVEQTKEDPLILCLKSSGIQVDSAYLKQFIQKFSNNFEWNEEMYWSKPLSQKSEEKEEDSLMDEQVQRQQTGEDDLDSYGFGYSA